MRRWIVGLACGVAFVGLGAGVSAQGGRGAVPPPTKGTGLILGQVVDGSTGQPLPGATVALTSPTGAGPGRGARGGLGATGMDIVAGVGSTTSQAGISIPNFALGAPGGTRVLTDEQGHFVFHDLPAASFSLAVTAPGFVPGGFGQTRPNGPTRTLDLADGQRSNDARIRLWKYAVVTGNVQDEVGQPAVGVTVRALRKTTANGRARLVATGNGGTTDDRGDFRLSTLVPGDYIVAIPETQVTMPVPIVQAMTDSLMSGRGSGGGILEFASSGGPMPSPEGLRIGDNLLQSPGQDKVPAPLVDGALGAYLSQYFPSALSPSQAAVLSLRSGEMKDGVNLQLRLSATSAVSGTVVGPDGPVANAPVKLTPSAVDDAGIDSGFETASTLTRADGSFVLLAVPAGQYTIRAAKMPRPPMPGGRGAGLAAMVLGDMTPGAGQTTVGLYAQSTVAVQGKEVVGVSLQLREGARVNGRIEFVGSATPPQPRQLQALSISLTPIDTRAFPQPIGGPSAPSVDQSGQFKTVGNPPGRYTLNVAGPVPQGWTVRSIMINGRDVLTSPLDLTTTDVDGAVVTFSDKVGQIAGTVKGVPAGGSATVLVFPFDYQSWIANGMSPRRMRQSGASPTGSYSLGGLFGADYLVVAVDDNDLTDNIDPATFEALSKVATRVTLTDAEKKTVDLSVVRIK